MAISLQSLGCATKALLRLGTMLVRADIAGSLAMTVALLIYLNWR
jgi:hypothetical protein